MNTKNHNDYRKQSIILSFLIVFPIITVFLMAYISPRPVLVWKTTLSAKTISQQNAKMFKNNPAMENMGEFLLGGKRNGEPGKSLSPCSMKFSEEFEQATIYKEECPPLKKYHSQINRKITEDFVVPVGLEKRFDFWRKVYASWNADQVIIHPKAYPEVIFELIDFSSLPKNITDGERKAIEWSIKKMRAEYYLDILARLQENSGGGSLTADDKYVAKLMAHIKDKDKFVLASELHFQRGQADNFKDGLKLSSLYMNAIEAEFERMQVPKELAVIAFLESCFQLEATSKVGAKGLYQIMPHVGRSLLTISDNIDERLDPIKAARASAKILKKNYEQLNDWPLAITAYNHGAKGLKQGLEETNSNSLIGLINKYKNRRFGYASKNYFLGFLAVLDAVKNVTEIFPEIEPMKPLNYNTIYLSTSYHLNTVAELLNISEQTIGFLNPDLSDQIINNNGLLPKEYELKIPRSNNFVSTINLTDSTIFNQQGLGYPEQW